MAYYDIGEAFQIIEEEMIASMSRNLKRHLAKEKEENLNYPMWQAEQLAALNNFRKDNKKKFAKYFSTINSQIEEVLKKANESGQMEQEITILEAIRDGFKVYDYTEAKSVRGQFFKINDRKLNALITATKSDMAKAETAMLRQANDEYRKIIFNSEVYYNSGAGTLPQCVDMATKDFLSKGITCVEYANGVRVGIDVYSRMALRTAQTRAYLTGEATKRDEWGINTVIVNRRGVACPKCLKWVAKIYYDDVWGNSTIPKPPKYPLLSEAVAGGLYHPNCKDIHTTYFEDVSSPAKPMTQKEIDEANRVYALEQEQRYNERQIRKYKRLWDGSTDPENALKYKEKLHAWQDRQADFISANSDVLKRRPELERIWRLPDNLQYGRNSFTPLQQIGDTMKRDIEAATNELLEKAKNAEPQITADLKEIVGGTHGKLEGLDFRLKGRDSLNRKITSDVLAGNDLNNVKNSLYDLVRYTNCSPSEHLVRDYVTTVNELKAKGYKVVRVKNTLSKKNVAYRGINTVIETPDGYKFELQFHTPESLDVKEKVHKLYERQRVDGISKAEYDKLDREMRAMSDTIPDPDDIDAIKPFDTFKGEEPIDVELDPCADGHTWIEKIIKAPKCTEPGEKLSICSACGKQEREEIPALGHNMVAHVTAPTCTKEGYTHWICDRRGCLHNYKTDIKPALGHDYGEWTTTRQPTATEYGRKQRICKRCGKVSYSTIPKLKGVAAQPAVARDYDAEAQKIIHDQKGMTPAYEKVVTDHFSTGSETGKKAFIKYVPSNSVRDSAYVGTPHYSPSQRIVNMDFAADLVNKRGAGTTFFHEHGHYIDFTAQSIPISRDPDFKQALKSDFDNYVNAVKKAKQVKTKTEAYSHIAWELQSDDTHAISDLCGGLSRNQARGRYGHRLDYWKNTNAITDEAFAHMFDAEFNPVKRKLMEKYFPTAFKKFEELLGGIV